MAGFVLANGSMSSNQSGEATIRQALIENDLVDTWSPSLASSYNNKQITMCLCFFAEKYDRQVVPARGVGNIAVAKANPLHRCTSMGTRVDQMIFRQRAADRQAVAHVGRERRRIGDVENLGQCATRRLNVTLSNKEFMCLPSRKATCKRSYFECAKSSFHSHQHQRKKSCATLKY